MSSAFARAVKWSLVTINPVPLSEPPVPRKKNGLALTPAQLRLAIDASTGCWCLPIFLELSSAPGARRGEVLALRWADLQDGELFIARSLSQTKAGLSFKGTKTGTVRAVVLPESAVSALQTHRAAQAAFRQQFGTDYRTDLDLIFANPDGTLLSYQLYGEEGLLIADLDLSKATGLLASRCRTGL